MHIWYCKLLARGVGAMLLVAPNAASRLADAQIACGASCAPPALSTAWSCEPQPHCLVGKQRHGLGNHLVYARCKQLYCTLPHIYWQITTLSSRDSLSVEVCDAAKVLPAMGRVAALIARVRVLRCHSCTAVRGPGRWYVATARVATILGKDRNHPLWR